MTHLNPHHSGLEYKPMLGLADQCQLGYELESAECMPRTYEIRSVSTFEVCVRADLMWETLRRQAEECISPPSGPSPDCRCSYCKEEFETRHYTAFNKAGWIRTALGLESI